MTKLIATLIATQTSALTATLISAGAMGLLASSAASQACFAAPGAAIGIAQDSISSPQPIGFAFPFAGTTYSDISISDHGICFLSNAGVPAAPTATPLVYSPQAVELANNGPVIAPFWTDTIPGSIGDVYLDGTASEFVITWQDMINFGGTQTYSFQMTLSISGQIKVVYDANVTNASIFPSPADHSIIGCSPGGGALLPGSVDLSAGPTTLDNSTYEEFLVANTFDMPSHGFRMTPVNPGYVVQPLGGIASCASVLSYGTGCGGVQANLFEQLDEGQFDLSGSTITLLRIGAGYTAFDSISGLFRAPTAAAVVIALGDDLEETVSLSSAMPIPGGTTTELTVSSNGQITLGAIGNGTGFDPNLAEWLASTAPMVSPMWHDFQPDATGSGMISFEEIGGLAIVSWNNVWNWGTTFGETFQVQFELATGTITIIYGAVTQNTGNDYLVGFTAGGALTDGGGNDLSAELAGTISIGDVEVLPLPLAASSNVPMLNSNWIITTSNIDAISPLAITFFGDAQGLGIPLQAIGLDAPGCAFWINTTLGSLTGLAASGSTTVSFPIPNNPTLVGAILTAQSICLTHQNPANLLSSNGLQATLGL